MIYDHANAPGATVHDLDSGERINNVLQVNTHAGWIKVAEQPLRLSERGQVASRRIRFDSVWPIYGLERMPVLIHCVGRQP